jgi:hypothetical protein
LDFNKNFIDVLSIHRFYSYEILCSQNSQAHLIGAYHWNLLICSTLYPFIQSAEIALRNAIHNALKEKFHTEYWFDQITLSYEAKQMVDKARAELQKRKAHIQAQDIVASLTFGFWLTLLQNKLHSNQSNPEKLWPQLIPIVFPHYKRGESERKLISARFREIKNIRNRLFHHEPIWKFDNDATAEKNISILRNKFEDIVKAIGWISKEKKVYLREFGFVDQFRSNCDINALREFQEKCCNMKLL